MLSNIGEHDKIVFVDISIPTRIETNRLLLRPFEVGDVSALFEFHKASAKELNLWYGGTLSKKELTQDDCNQYVLQALSELYAKSFISYAAFDRQTNELIGSGSFHSLDWQVPKGRLGYLVRTDLGGNGYATEMANLLTRIGFDNLKLKRLEIRTATRNKPSCVVPRKLNYEFLTIFEKNKAGNNGEIWDLEIHTRFDADNLPDLQYQITESI